MAPAEEGLLLLRRRLPRLVQELEGCGEPMRLAPELLEARHQELLLRVGGSLLQAEQEHEPQIMVMIYAEIASARLRAGVVVVLSGSSERLGALDSFLKSDCWAMGLCSKASSLWLLMRAGSALAISSRGSAHLAFDEPVHEARIR